MYSLLVIGLQWIYHLAAAFDKLSYLHRLIYRNTCNRGASHCFKICRGSCHLGYTEEVFTCDWSKYQEKRCSHVGDWSVARTRKFFCKHPNMSTSFPWQCGYLNRSLGCLQIVRTVRAIPKPVEVSRPIMTLPTPPPQYMPRHTMDLMDFAHDMMIDDDDDDSSYDDDVCSVM